MKKSIFIPFFLIIYLVISFYGNANAALWERTDNLVYDDILDITWLRNTNSAQLTGYVANYDVLGRMSWEESMGWINYLNGINYLGYHDWRLPSTNPVNGTSYNYSLSYNGSTDHGYNNLSRQSELAYMYYVNLNNIAYYDNYGHPSQLGWDTKNAGPFTDFDFSINSVYWSETICNLRNDAAWSFGFYRGYQTVNSNSDMCYAWAVRNGDVVAPVPLPSTLFLFVSGLLGLIGIKVRKKRR